VQGQIPEEAIEAIVPLEDFFLSCSITPSLTAKFPLEGHSQIRKTDEILNEVIAPGTMLERLRKGAKAAISILKLQGDMSDITQETEYDAFLSKASLIAREFALFPCTRDEVGALWRTISKSSGRIRAEVRKEFKRQAVLEKLKGVGDQIEDLIQIFEREAI
jgi:hypothetical protein